MLKRKASFVQTASFLTGILLLLLVTFSTPTTVRADGPTPNNGTCVTCHEDLYFLHDTGNWFCLKESPMACVDCHGGDPNTLDKDLAHTKRAPHPIINEDVTKCQQCHPEQCTERVALFDKAAGISNVLVAAPYTPSYASQVLEKGFPPADQKAEGTNRWLGAMELLSALLVSGTALGIYIYYRRGHISKG